MVSKRFGALDLISNIDTVLMTGAPNNDSTCNIRFTNRNASSSVKIRLALVDADGASALASLSNEDYLEFDTTILANEVLEDTGVVVPESFSLVVRSDTNDVTAIAFGFQEQVI